MDKLVGIQEHATKHCEPVLLDELEAEGLLFRSGKPTKGELVSPADLCVSIVAGLAQETLAKKSRLFDNKRAIEHAESLER